MGLLITKDAFSTAEQALAVNCVEDEYLVLERHAALHYGLKQAFPVRQRLSVQGDHAFDILYLDLPDGSVREYWFNISSFYGREIIDLFFEDDDAN